MGGVQKHYGVVSWYSFPSIWHPLNLDLKKSTLRILGMSWSVKTTCFEAVSGCHKWRVWMSGVSIVLGSGSLGQNKQSLQFQVAEYFVNAQLPGRRTRPGQASHGWWLQIYGACRWKRFEYMQFTTQFTTLQCFHRKKETQHSLSFITTPNFRMVGSIPPRFFSSDFFLPPLQHLSYLFPSPVTVYSRHPTGLPPRPPKKNKLVGGFLPPI